MFPAEEQVAQNHIIVDAILQYIYLDVLKDEERLKRNIDRAECTRILGYLHAWKIVEKLGYKKK